MDLCPEHGTSLAPPIIPDQSFARISPEKERFRNLAEGGIFQVGTEYQIVVLRPGVVPISSQLFVVLLPEEKRGMYQGRFHEQILHHGFVRQEGIRPRFITHHSRGEDTRIADHPHPRTDQIESSAI